MGDFLVGADARPLPVDLGEMVTYLAGFGANRPATAPTRIMGPDTIGFWGQPLEGVSGRFPVRDRVG